MSSPTAMSTQRMRLNIRLPSAWVATISRVWYGARTFMIVIRAETVADLSAIHEVNAHAFGRQGEAQLVDALRASESFLRELSLVAVSNGRVVGHVLFTRIHIRTPDRNVPALALAPLAVHPVCQSQGIGSALVRRGLDDARSLGHAIIVVVGHPKYYPRFGFVSAREIGRAHV